MRTFAFVPVDLFLGNDDAFVNLPFFLGSSAALLLRALSYLRVRRLGRDFLTILWGYLVVASAIGTSALGTVILVDLLFPGASPGTVLGRTLSIYGLAVLPEVVALLWFARRASGLSLVHAGFLLVFSSFTVVGPVTGSTTAAGGAPYFLGAYLLGGAIGLTVMLTKVWLLGNFDRRGPGFRRNAVIGLMATVVLSGHLRILAGALIGYIEGPYLTFVPLLGLVVDVLAFVVSTAFSLMTVVVLFALIYLVRVREPAATPTTPSGER